MIFLKKKNNNGGEKKDTALTEKELEEEIYRLGELCKMGDIVAMYDMAILWRNRCPLELKKLIDQYENNTSDKTFQNLAVHMNKIHINNEFEFYAMWLIRAALYGHPIASEIVERCSYYKERTYIPYTFYTDRKTSKPYLFSDFFYEAGFNDIIRDKMSCILIYYKEDGYFEFNYVSSYLPPDEDGFGSETDYDYLCYDEFFRKLPLAPNAKRSDILEALKKADEQRNQYWNSTTNYEQRKYKQLLKNCRNG